VIDVRARGGRGRPRRTFRLTPCAVDCNFKQYLNDRLNAAAGGLQNIPELC